MCKTPLIALLLCCCFFSCIDEYPTLQLTRLSAEVRDRPAPSFSADSSIYDFPNRVSCSSNFGEQCFSGPEEYAIYTAAEAEKTVRSFVNIDLQTEKDVSNKFHEQQNYRFIEDERTAKLRRILNKMLPHVGRTEIPYSVYLVQNNEVNAWTVAGGNIYFTTGILSSTKSDDEIANVLGHEIGHNECKHTLKAMQRVALARMPQDALKSIFGIESPINAETLVGMMNMGTVAFGQHEELESDRTGMQLAALAGYDPLKGLEFWKRMAAGENENILEKMFRSHPYSQARFDCGKSFLESKKKNKKK